MVNWNNRKSSDRSCWSPKTTSVLPQIRFDMHMPATHGSILLHDWESKAVYLCSSRSAEAAAAALVVDLVAGRRTTAPYFLVSPERTSFTHFARPESPSASWRFVRAASRDAFVERENVFLHFLSPQVQNVCQICILRWRTIWQCKVTSAMHFIILYSCICICMSSVEVSLMWLQSCTSTLEQLRVLSIQSLISFVSLVADSSDLRVFRH